MAVAEEIHPSSIWCGDIKKHGPLSSMLFSNLQASPHAHLTLPLPLALPRATPPLAPLAVPAAPPPLAIPLPLAPAPLLAVEPPRAIPLLLLPPRVAGVRADGTLLYLLGGLEVVGGCSTNDVSVVRKVASTSGGAVCAGMGPWRFAPSGEEEEEKVRARAKDWGIGACLGWGESG